MIKKLTILFLFLSGITVFGQSVIFLHHSTGAGVYEEGNVPGWISNYNTNNGTNYQITERSYPNTPYEWANYPFDYWNLWINNQCNSTNPNIHCLNNIVQGYDVIIFKHCFPGAAIQPDNGNPLVSSDIKTIANYKLQYRALRSLMDQYPNKKFIIWTLAPLHRLITTTEEADRAKQFVDWVKTSWLTEDGKLHPNIYIFDFFGLAAETNSSPANGKVNCLKYIYEKSHTDSDSHPNTLANQSIGPLFAQFIVNTIKNQSTNTELLNYNIPSIKVYPNPASSNILIDFTEINCQVTSLHIFNLLGELVFKIQVNVDKQILIDTSKLPSGSYLLKVNTDLDPILHRLLIVHD